MNQQDTSFYKTLKENKKKTIICVICYWGLIDIWNWMTNTKMLCLAAILLSYSRFINSYLHKYTGPSILRI